MKITTVKKLLKVIAKPDYSFKFAINTQIASDSKKAIIKNDLKDDISEKRKKYKLGLGYSEEPLIFKGKLLDSILPTNKGISMMDYGAHHIERFDFIKINLKKIERIITKKLESEAKKENKK